MVIKIMQSNHQQSRELPIRLKMEKLQHGLMAKAKRFGNQGQCIHRCKPSILKDGFSEPNTLPCQIVQN